MRTPRRASDQASSHVSAKVRQSLAEPSRYRIHPRWRRVVAAIPMALPLAVATVLRVAGLGERPLDPDEGSIAMVGWRLWRDSVLTMDISPVLPSLLSWLFGAFSAADGLARLPVAVAGVALVGIPLLLRHELGLGPALAAAWLLAMSPVLTVASRTLSGDVVALLALGLVVAAAARWIDAVPNHAVAQRGFGHHSRVEEDGRDQPGERLSVSAPQVWAAVLGCGLALGFGVSFSFLLWLAVVGLAALVAWGVRTSRALFQSINAYWRPFALGFAAVVVVLHTRLLTAPAGLHAGLVEPLWRGWMEFTWGLDVRQLVLLASVEAPLVGLAMASLWLHTKHAHLGFVRFLALWLALSLPLVVLPRQAPLGVLILPLLPSALLAGRALQIAWRLVWADSTWRAAALAALAWVPIAYLALSGHAAAYRTEPFPVVPLVVAAAGVLLVAVLGSGWLDRREVCAGALLIALSAGVFLTVAFHGRLSLRQDEPYALPGSWTTTGVRQLVSDAERWSRQHPDERLTVDPAAASWVLWPLRNTPLVVVEEGNSALIVPSEPQTSRSSQARQAGQLYAVGAVVRWADRPDLRQWWQWLTRGRDWVTLRPYGIIFDRN